MTRFGVDARPKALHNIEMTLRTIVMIYYLSKDIWTGNPDRHNIVKSGLFVRTVMEFPTSEFIEFQKAPRFMDIWTAARDATRDPLQVSVWQA